MLYTSETENIATERLNVYTQALESMETQYYNKIHAIEMQYGKAQQDTAKKRTEELYAIRIQYYEELSELMNEIDKQFGTELQDVRVQYYKKLFGLLYSTNMRLSEEWMETQNEHEQGQQDINIKHTEKLRYIDESYSDTLSDIKRQYSEKLFDIETRYDEKLQEHPILSQRSELTSYEIRTRIKTMQAKEIQRAMDIRDLQRQNAEAKNVKAQQQAEEIKAKDEQGIKALYDIQMQHYQAQKEDLLAMEQLDVLRYRTEKEALLAIEQLEKKTLANGAQTKFSTTNHDGKSPTYVARLEQERNAHMANYSWCSIL